MAEAAISEVPTLNYRISPEEASAAATEFLLDHVGNQLVPGQPQLMVSAVRAVWIVPIQLTYIHTGILGTVGVVAVDDETSQVIAWTPIPQIKAASCQLREQREPELSQQFKTFTSQP